MFLSPSKVLESTPIIVNYICDTFSRKNPLLIKTVVKEIRQKLDENIKTQNPQIGTINWR